MISQWFNDGQSNTGSPVTDMKSCIAAVNSAQNDDVDILFSPTEYEKACASVAAGCPGSNWNPTPNPINPNGPPRPNPFGPPGPHSGPGPQPFGPFGASNTVPGFKKAAQLQIPPGCVIHSAHALGGPGTAGAAEAVAVCPDGGLWQCMGQSASGLGQWKAQCFPFHWGNGPGNDPMGASPERTPGHHPEPEGGIY